MAQNFLQIVELESLDRNRAPGLRIKSIFGTSIRYSMPPTWLFNLGPDRQGGYRAYGRRVQVVILDEGASPVAIPTAQLIGADSSGIASFAG
jgi:hypothetical protein